MEKFPLVSIALCTFNGERYIPEQLDSILAQNYPNLEIVLFDDASTDGTAEILASYQLSFPSIHLHVNKKNVGFNENFKSALNACKGTYIAIADQDDVWLPNKISHLVEHIGENMLIYHDSTYIDAQGTALKKNTSSHHRFASGNCSESFLYYNCVSGHACLIHRELVKCLDYKPEDMYYDWWLAYTAACSGKISFVEESLVKHRKHPESSTSKDSSSPRALRIKQLKDFKSHPSTPLLLKTLIKKLLDSYAAAEKKGFSFKLFMLLIANTDLLFIRKRNFFSKYKWMIKECRRSR